MEARRAGAETSAAELPDDQRTRLRHTREMPDTNIRDVVARRHTRVLTRQQIQHRYRRRRRVEGDRDHGVAARVARQIRSDRVDRPDLIGQPTREERLRPTTRTPSMEAKGAGAETGAAELPDDQRTRLRHTREMPHTNIRDVVA